MLTPDEQAELNRLEATFEENGGRGVGQADRIDDLRAKQNTNEYSVYLEGYSTRELNITAADVDRAVEIARMGDDVLEPGEEYLDIDYFTEDETVRRVFIGSQLVWEDAPPLQKIRDAFGTGSPQEVLDKIATILRAEGFPPRPRPN